MKIWRILPALALFIFIGWIIILANKGDNSVFFELVSYIPFGDKLGHFILYGSLSVLTVIALDFKYVLINDYRIYYGSLIILLFALVEETTQIFLPNRTFDMVDISADVAGIVIFQLLYFKFSKKL